MKTRFETIKTIVLVTTSSVLIGCVDRGLHVADLYKDESQKIEMQLPGPELGLLDADDVVNPKEEDRNRPAPIVPDLRQLKCVSTQVLVNDHSEFSNTKILSLEKYEVEIEVASDRALKPKTFIVRHYKNNILNSEKTVNITVFKDYGHMLDASDDTVTFRYSADRRIGEGHIIGGSVITSFGLTCASN